MQDAMMRTYCKKRSIIKIYTDKEGKLRTAFIAVTQLRNQLIYD